jgi:hypothetical protein
VGWERTMAELALQLGDLQAAICHALQVGLLLQSEDTPGALLSASAAIHVAVHHRTVSNAYLHYLQYAVTI